MVGASGLVAQFRPLFDGNYNDEERIKQDKRPTDQFVFARMIYNGRMPRYYKNWFNDYPKSDLLLIAGLKRLTNLNIANYERVVAINDSDLFKYPFIYTSQPGQMVLTEGDAAILREYLARGGFWILDDFWGSLEWDNFAAEFKKVLPGATIEDIELIDPLFGAFYHIDELVQVPSYAYTLNGGITYELDGVVVECKGVRDRQGRLMVVINHNTHLNEAFEFADDPKYPLPFSDFAYQMAINLIVYALSH